MQLPFSPSIQLQLPAAPCCCSRFPPTVFNGQFPSPFFIPLPSPHSQSSQFGCWMEGPSLGNLTPPPVHSASSSSPSSSSSPEPEAEQQQQQPSSITYRVNISIWGSGDTVAMRDDAFSCIIVLVTFWFFASMTLILGFYGSVNLYLGPNCSRLLRVNSFFVQDIKVSAAANTISSPTLYGFVKTPKLDMQTTWNEDHAATIPESSHKEWIYYLNGGSQINISYSVKSDSSFPLSLVIAEGKENLIEWIEDPSYPNTTLSWNIVHGSGLVKQTIYRTSDYYVAVGNLNPENVEVELNISIHAFTYNTKGAYYKCSLADAVCTFKLFFLGANTALLTTPGTEEGLQENGWYAKVSYGPRWLTYFGGSGGITLIILLAFKIYTKFQTAAGDAIEYQEREQRPERTPLLTQKDDDVESWGSSYDSVSNDEGEGEDKLISASAEGKSLKEGATNNPRRLCVVCFDAARDCFFLPCGHSAACFACGTRIVEEAGTCPICRRRMKKVRKIITV